MALKKINSEYNPIGCCFPESADRQTQLDRSWVQRQSTRIIRGTEKAPHRERLKRLGLQIQLTLKGQVQTQDLEGSFLFSHAGLLVEKFVSHFILD